MGFPVSEIHLYARQSQKYSFSMEPFVCNRTENNNYGFVATSVKEIMTYEKFYVSLRKA